MTSQSVASPVADPGVRSTIPALPHTFVEIDFEIFSRVILLDPSADSSKTVVRHKQKYVHGIRLSQSLPRKGVVRLTDSLNMTISQLTGMLNHKPTLAKFNQS